MFNSYKGLLEEKIQKSCQLKFIGTTFRQPGAEKLLIDRSGVSNMSMSMIRID